jgi:uncharacterized lipoprotein YddW (UPF0748 family)
MSRGIRAAMRASVLIATIWMLTGTRWEPLPTEGAPFFFRDAADSSVLAPPYLARLRERTQILPDNEVRALWVVRDAITTPESITELVDFAVQTRFHLLFVQVRGRGDAYYRSSLEPAATALSAPLEDFDPLEYLVTLAHRSGIEVHAWLNVFYAWSNPGEEPPPDHLVSRHPDWLLTSARGLRMDRVPRSRWKAEHIEGYFLSPGVAALRTHMQAVVRELVGAYALDGIHLDYIRYPNREYSFDPQSRTRFYLSRGVDPVDLAGNRALLQRMVGAPALSIMDSLYREFRVEQVDSMVMAIRAACPGLALSAAVVADPVAARQEKGQDWARWVHRGWVDFVVPMAYSMPPLEIEHRARVYHRTVGVDRLLIGLGVYGGRDEYLAESVGLLREVGVAGYAIFSYNALAETIDGALLIENAVLPPDTIDADAESDSLDVDSGEDDGEE